MQVPENLLPLLLGAALRIGVAFVVFLVGRWFAPFARRKLQPILKRPSSPSSW